ncbi:MAG: bifunctional proline dehydrogenase/L-glutamate gamma-semialdehyde dehydrogenase [Phycisphaeraceae bacterium]|nr:proline dehydrogenase family protein [Phycisphaerales bacterium]MCB9843029.1 bifunctional proline dehydrogenase/L-glutamate gamma-semialdehyde dehydrogenase [Phycisphaeraceae bacterium]
MALFTRRSQKRVVVQPGVPHPTAPSASAPPGQREARIFELGSELLERARKHKSGLLSRAFWSDKLMDWAMKDHQFKVQLFRFVDCFPVIRHDPDLVHEILVDYLSQPGVKLPTGFGSLVSAGGVAKGMMTKTVTSQIEGMAKKFIAGEDAKSALPGLRKLWNDGIAFSVDLLGEACVSDAEADAYRDKYLDLVANLPPSVKDWPANERLERDHLGVVPRVNVSIKVSSLSAKCDPIDTEGSIGDLMTRIVPILEAAKERGVFVNFDMEQFALKDLTLELFMRCCEKIDFAAGIAMQAYLKSGDADARRICEWAKRTGRVVSVRLVKGAYWDYETIHAEQQGWACPVWNTKRRTDACFERMTEIFLDAMPTKAGQGGGGGVKLALGSHNARSIAAALDGLERRNLPRNAIELQMLHGMADQLKAAAEEMDLRVREYVPVGEMIPGMAYLVRRLLENTSNESWLKAGFLDDADAGVLLQSPHDSSADAKPDLYTLAAERHSLSPSDPRVGDGKAFATDPMRDFSQKPVRERFADAIGNARVPGVKNDTTVEQALAMVGRAEAYFPKWRDEDPYKRAAVLTKAAEIMRQRRDELSGVIIKENGKDWRNADADVTEAIDFLEYYARCSSQLFGRHRLGKFIGELDETWYQPRGVAVVISPWNFPLAIAAGMASAALVTGNTVILKPAEQTPGIAKLLVEILHEAGAPKDAMQFCPGVGETVGAALVADERVALVAFTGSKQVGLSIIQTCARTPDSQGHIKKVIAELGGKNAIIVDTSADLDEAVLGVRQSAFGFQGQKCSACSRVIVVDPEGPEGRHTRTFIERFVHATESLVIKSPIAPGCDVGPVIDDEAAARIRGFIAKAVEEGCVLQTPKTPSPAGSASSPSRGEGADGVIPGNYIAPHVFTGVKPEHTIAREEIFGPVVAVMHAPDFETALNLANSSKYKLTGGVFTRKPAHIERAKREFRVGNLYINRGCTGALVARQPFGGFGMSGVGSKAGGADYLLQFVEPRACCENTMRRGFAPEL